MADSPNKGGRKPRVSDEDLLTVFRSTNDPVLSTAEIANEVPIKRRGTLRRLRNLEESGTLESKQIGGRNTVWWLSNEESNEATREPTRDDTTTTGEAESVDDTTDESDHRDDESETTGWFPQLDLPGSGEKLEQRHEAVKACYEYLKEQGEAKAGDFQDDVYPDYPAGYTEGKNPPYSWWTNCVYKGMKQLAKGYDENIQVPDTREPWEYDQ